MKGGRPSTVCEPLSLCQEYPLDNLPQIIENPI